MTKNNVVPPPPDILAQALRKAVECSGDVIFMTDANGVYTFVNPEFTRLYGYTANEVVGKCTPEILKPSMNKQADKHLWKSLLMSGGERREVVSRSKAGHFIYIEGSSYALLDEAGQPAGYLAVQRNITERKRSEEMESAVYRISEAAANSATLADLYKSVHEIISAVMVAQNFFFALFDERDNIISFPYYVDEVDSAPEPRMPRRGLTEYVLRTGKSLLCDRVFDAELARNGDIEVVGTESAIWLGVPLKIDRKTIGVMVVQDYSDPKAYGPREQQMLEYVSAQVAAAIETKRAGAALRQSEARYQSLFARMMDGVYRSTPEGKFVEINEAMVRMFRYDSKEELLNVDIKKDLYFAPEDRESLFLDTGLEKIEIFEMRRKDGTSVWVEDHGQYVHDEHGKVIYHEGILRDVTERMKIEEALRESEQRYRLVLEQTGQLVYDYLLANGTRAWSGAIERVTGFSKEEFHEASDSQWENMIHPEDRKATIDALQTAIAEGKNYHVEYRFRKKDHSYINIDDNGIILFNREKKPYRLLGTMADITGRKGLERQFLRAQRMESVGTLAGGMAHDLNNVLAPVLMSLSILGQKLTAEADQKMIADLKKIVQRGANLIKQVLAFSRGTEIDRTEIQIAFLIEEINKLVKETFPADIEISTRIPNTIWTIMGDSTQIHQIILNLCVNARDAMPSGGTLSITASNFMVDESYAKVNLEAKVGPYVLISVRDTGQGIPPAILERIFEPFFTTKEVGKGTGLGLSTVYAIVKAHSGFVHVYSEPEKGTKFDIYLPAMLSGVGKEAFEEKERHMPIVRGNNELILVVDDESAVRDVSQMTLVTYGYRVLTAADGAEAITKYVMHQNDIRLVITDINMPTLDGPTLIRELRTIKSDVRIIVASGFGDRSKMKDIPKNDIYRFLMKPFTAEELLHNVQEVLKSN